MHLAAKAALFFRRHEKALVPAATFAFFFFMIMTAAAAAFFMVMPVMTAATALAFSVMMAVTAAAAFAFFLFVIMTAAAAAFFMVVPVMTAATAAARFDADRIERRVVLDGRKPHHCEHLCEVGLRQHGKAIGRVGHAHAASSKRRNGFAHDVDVARHAENLFGSRTHHPEGSRFIKEDVVHFERAHFGGSHLDETGFGMNFLRALEALGACERQLMGLLEDGFRGRRLRRKKFGKRGHEIKSLT